MSWAPSWTEKFQISILVTVRLVPAGESGDLFSFMKIPSWKKMHVDYYTSSLVPTKPPICDKMSEPDILATFVLYTWIKIHLGRMPNASWEKRK